MSISSAPLKSRSPNRTLAPKYARLQAVIRDSAHNLEGGARTVRSDVLELQRKAIASLEECSQVALELAECLQSASCPRDSACLRPGDWNRCNACFTEQVSRFFDQASKFLAAIVQSGAPGALARVKDEKHGRPVYDDLPDRIATFTDAQRRVFERLVTGLPNKLIAYEIGVSEATVKAHVSAVLRKLRVRSRAQAIALSSAFQRDRREHSNLSA
jgi:DNA-binding CsgD family transcriptional regulator